jgi:hypothetical protein
MVVRSRGEFEEAVGGKYAGTPDGVSKERIAQRNDRVSSRLQVHVDSSDAGGREEIYGSSVSGGRILRYSQR